MKHWFARVPDEQPLPLTTAALCRLVDALGTEDFVQALMSAVQTQVRIFQIGVSRVDADNTLNNLWFRSAIDDDEAHQRVGAGAREYAGRFYMSDPLARFVPELRALAKQDAMPVLLHRMAGEEVPNRDWRHSNYQNAGMLERLSIVCALPDEEVFGLSLFRHASQGGYEQDELDWITACAPVLMRLAIRNDRSLRRPAGARPAAPRVVAPVDGSRAMLTPRESEVCNHILHGLSYADIGQALGIGAESVRTYRNRAFAKLGITSRNELFAMFMG